MLVTSIKKCNKKIICKICENQFSGKENLTDTNDIFLFYKNYNTNGSCALIKPTDFLINFV